MIQEPGSLFQERGWPSQPREMLFRVSRGRQVFVSGLFSACSFSRPASALPTVLLAARLIYFRLFGYRGLALGHSVLSSLYPANNPAHRLRVVSNGAGYIV